MKRSTFILAALMAAAALIVACSDSNGPTAPTVAPPVASSPNIPTPPPAPPANRPTTSGEPTTPTVQGVTGSISKNAGSKARAFATNNATVGRMVCLATYENPDGEISTQELHDFECLEIQPGESHDFAVDLPACAWQSDLFVGRNAPREPPFYTPQELLAFREGGSGKCAPPPPPPPTGCQLDLVCSEERGENAQIIANGLDKHLVCNHPGQWTHDADEAETSDTRFWGHWASGESPRTANVKFTAARDGRCMASFSWPVPVDPCVNAELEIDVDTESTDTTTTVIVRVESSGPGFVDFTQGETTVRKNFGAGVTVLQQSYPRDEVNRNVFVVAVTDCLERKGQAQIPRLPTCEEQNPETNFSGGGSWRVVTNNTIFRRADVSASFSLDGAAFDGEAQIYWVNGNSNTVKERKPVKIRCGGELEGSITWNNGSHNHFCNHGHVNSGARYFLRLVDGGGVQFSEELTDLGGRCQGD